MRSLKISTGRTIIGNSRVKRGTVSWADILEKKLGHFHVSEMTQAQYMALDSRGQLHEKDRAGHYIGGWIQNDIRGHGNPLLVRDFGGLDIDHLSLEELLDLRLAYSQFEYVLHSTHKHTPEQPRLRLVVPFDRPVKPHEYIPLMRALANLLGMDYFDDTTYQPTRVMFWPGRCSDGEELWEHNEGDWLPVDELLATLDVEDPMTWPLSSRESTPMLHNASVENPLEKDGVVGAFCRAYYPIQLAIQEFELPYTEVHERRYTYLGGTSAEGAVIYDEDTHLYSNHESDPAFGHSRNAFDLVRVHLFGDDSDWDGAISEAPSFQEMQKLAMSNERVLQELDIDATEEFADVDTSVEAMVGEALRSPQAQQQADDVISGRVDEEDVVAKLSPFETLRQEVLDGPDLKRDDIRKVIAKANTLLHLTDIDVDVLTQVILDKAPGMGLTKPSIRKQLKSSRDALNTGDVDRLLIQEFLREWFDGGDHLKRVAKIFWSWEAGYWRQLDDEIVQGRLSDTITRLRREQPDDKELAAVVADVIERRTSAIVEGAMKTLKATLAARERRDDPLRLLEPVYKPRINTESGLIQFDYDGTWELLPHRPDDFMTWKVHAPWDPGAECPLFDDFLHHVFRNCLDPEGMVRHVWELIGYCINDSRWMKRWVLLHGATNTGKSTLLRVLQALLGDACLAQEMATYGSNKNQFTEGGLLGKLLLADDDFDKAGSLPDGLLKRISEEKRITTEIKFGGLLSFMARVVPVICSNHRPVTRDVSTAFRDRALVIDFDVPFVGAERSDQVRDRMLSELPGILVKAVDGLSRLRARGEFDVPIDGQAAHRSWEKNSNAVMMWLDECTLQQTSAEGGRWEMKRSDAWRSFDRWMRDAGGAARMSKGQFFERLEMILGNPGKRDGVIGWTGVQLSDDTVVDPETEFE